MFYLTLDYGLKIRHILACRVSLREKKPLQLAQIFRADVQSIEEGSDSARLGKEKN